MAIPYHTHLFEIPSATRQDIVAGVAVDKVVVPAVLGSAAVENVSAFATAEQGAKADRALSAERKIIAGDGLSGGGNLSEDRTISLDDEILKTFERVKETVSSRVVINTGPGLIGGGNLTRDITIDLSQETILALVKAEESVPAGRKVTSGQGLAGGGTLDEDIRLELDDITLELIRKIRTAVQKTEVGALGFKDKVSVRDIAATTKPTAETFLRGDGAWAKPADGSMFPTGMIAAFAAQTPPEGWLVCDGAEVSQSRYSSLFNVIGQQYGGDKTLMNFRLPDLRGDISHAGNPVSGQANTMSSTNTSGAKPADAPVYCIKT